MVAALAIAGLIAPSAALATGVADFPAESPSGHVLDSAELLSRAASGDVNQRLEQFSDLGVDARLVTLRRLERPQFGHPRRGIAAAVARGRTRACSSC